MNRKQAVSRCMTAVFFVAFMLTGPAADAGSEWRA